MSLFSRIYRFLNNLSIDVSLGAVICAVFFSCVLHADVRAAAFIALGLTVWIIYTTDHLLDAVKLKGQASTERHRLHQRNFKALALLVCMAIAGVIVCVFYLRPIVFGTGVIMGVLVCLYLLVNRKLGFMKEMAGAIFYAAGIVMPAIILSQFQITLSVALLIFQFLLTAWINMLLFSWFDVVNDRTDNRISFSTELGERITGNVLKILFVSCAILMGIQAITNFNWSMIIVAAMDLVLLVIFTYDGYFTVNDRYRLAGDAVFLFPIFYLLS